MAEGVDITGKNVCVVEDVITTGGQILLSTKDLRELGAKVHHVLGVIERTKRGKSKLIKRWLTATFLIYNG